MSLRVAELETLFTANVQDFVKKTDVVDKTQKALAKSDPTITVKADTTKALTGMREIEDSARKNGAAWESTGKGIMVAGGLMAAGVGLAVKSFADFDAAMSQVQAGTNTSGLALASLRAAAIDAGAKTQYSATEAADAITAMGKAGVSTKDILGGGLTGALSLAAAGQLAVGTAAEIAATSMVQFGLKGKDIPHIADLLAAGAGKAMGSVEDLSGALKYAGVVAKGAGWSIEETTGVLAEFAQAGIVGEQAGTSLRGVLMAMEAPTKIAAKTMEGLGFKLYDANGHFLKAAPLAQQLKDKLGPLDEATRNAALGQIFGNEQLTAAQVLYQGGAASVTDWTTKVNDAGFAAKQAAMLTDNLKGDVERLGGSLSSVLIVSGSGANGMLRSMTQELQGAVDLYGSLPTPVQQGALALGAVGAAALIAGGGLLVLAPRIVATKAALADMGRTGALMSSGLGKAATAGKMLGGPLLIATAALGYFAQQAQESSARVDEMAASLDAQTGAVTENTVAWVNKNMSDSGALAMANRIGIAAGDVTSAVLGNADATARVTAAVDAYTASLPDNHKGMLDAAETHHLLSNAISGGNEELNAGIEKTKLLAEANASAIDPTTGLTGAQKDANAATKALVPSEEDLTRAADAAKKAHDDLTAAITGFGSAMETARGDARSYEAAIDAATASLKANGKTLDIGTEKGRANQAALDGIATAALKSAESNLTAAEANGTLGRASKGVTGDVREARQAFIDQAVAMGMPKKAAAELATQSGLTAGRVKEITDKLIALGRQAPRPSVGVTGVDAAKAKVSSLQGYLDRLKSKNIVLNVTQQNSANKLLGMAQADGGTVHAASGMDRQSMIAKGGSNILWAEPETGWETYISGKPSQRARNIGLLEETARRFGLIVLPSGTTQYAGGSPAAPSPGRASSLVGLAIEGTLDLGNGLVGVMRGVVKAELAETGAKARYAGVS